MVSTATTTAGIGGDRRWTEARADPRSFLLFGMHVKGGARGVVHFFLPPVRQGRLLIGGRCFQKGLLGSCQSHGSLAPFLQMLVVMQLEIFTKLPSPPLLLPSRGTIVRQIRMRIIIKEPWHLGAKSISNPTHTTLHRMKPKLFYLRK